MPSFTKPRVYFSRCLGFEACRWNGVTITSEVAEQLKKHVETVHDCPEAGIGLGIPRKPVRVVLDDSKENYLLFQPETGVFFTDEMEKYIQAVLDGLGEVDGFLLKGRSPTCGLRDVNIYHGAKKTGVRGKASGLLGRMVLERYPHLPAEDEGRLTNFQLRDRFFTRIFTLAEMRNVAAAGTMAKLVKFHAKHKLLLMAAHQTEMRRMGKLVANHDKLPVGEVMSQYQAALQHALAAAVRRPAVINVLLHAFGYFKKVLTAREKARFLDMLEEYREGSMPLVAINSVLESWIERTDDAYLRQQSFFAPYPKALRDLTDTGKGRDY